MGPLAEIPYPRIDPVIVEFGALGVRWYGLSYIFSFVAAFLVLRALSRRGRLPIAEAKVADFLFWGVLGVFIGGRLGYIAFYMIPSGEFEWNKVHRVWEGGMSFHGGLIGVVAAYTLVWLRTRFRLSDVCDGLALATTPGLLFVRLANFINAELVGTVTDVPWAMRFPDYASTGLNRWESAGKPYLADLRHPSQLYEGLAEGLVLFLVLRCLMLKRGWGGGRVAGMFLVLYGTFRFLAEFLREPDAKLGRHIFGVFTQGQALSAAMVAVGALVLWLLTKKGARPGQYDLATGQPLELPRA